MKIIKEISVFRSLSENSDTLL